MSGQSTLQDECATCHEDDMKWLCTQKQNRKVQIYCKVLPWTSSCTSWWSWPYRLLAWQKYDPLSAVSAPAICSSARTPSGVGSCFTETLNYKNMQVKFFIASMWEVLLMWIWNLGCLRKGEMERKARQDREGKQGRGNWRTGNERKGKSRSVGWHA